LPPAANQPGTPVEGYIFIKFLARRRTQVKPAFFVFASSKMFKKVLTLEGIRTLGRRVFPAFLILLSFISGKKQNAKMDYMRHKDRGGASGPHTGHKMSDMHVSHDRHAGHSVVMFRDKFWLSFALTIPVVVWSTDVQRWLGYTAPSFPGSKFIPAILGTVVFVYGGLVFVRGAWGELADRKPGMMTLISLAIVVAFGTSLAATFGLFEIDVWWELASLITIMVLGHWLEMRAISQACGALNALAALLPDTAERVKGADTESVPLSEL
jgi:P-type Cu2+ transporter